MSTYAIDHQSVLNTVSSKVCLISVAILAFSLSACSGKKLGSSGIVGSSVYLSAAQAGEHRSVKNKARDIYRHPKKTLEFFELDPDMSVVEVWPGGGGWYTEILAPYLRERGTLYLADFGEGLDGDYVTKSRAKLRNKLSENPDVYDKAILTSFNPGQDDAIAPAGSVERVLTFRNAHNWYMYGGGTAKVEAAMQAFYKALKPGGILGLVDHRLPESADDIMMRESGYIKKSTVVNAAEKAGFVLLGSAEINANSKDTADYPKGVWTLPPSLRLGDESKAKYLLIGESDRMTLKFKKAD